MRISVSLFALLAVSALANTSPTGTAAALAQQKGELDGFWVLEKASSTGKLPWPFIHEEAIYVEGRKLLWVKKDGKILQNAVEAKLHIDASKTPHTLDIIITRGDGQTIAWQAIYKIEKDRLIIATNCDDENRPTEFGAAKKGGANFIRTYRLVKE